MALLVLQIPHRPRLAAGGPGPVDASADCEYVTSTDGLSVQSQGRCAAVLLPKADTVIAVLADTDVSWHRITLPKAPAARLRDALTGVLEEALLEDADDVHLAIAPGAKAGQPCWVAAVDRAWLRRELAALERAHVFVDRVVPVTWPDDPPLGHFSEAQADEAGSADPALNLSWAFAEGVAALNLRGGLARALLPAPLPDDARFSATPGAASAAEAWLGAPVTVMSPAERLLQAARSLWNLRQFELARRTRGARALGDGLRRLLSAEWRPVRWGLAALVVVQIAGLNLWAWHQQGQIEARRVRVQSLVRATFPRVNELDIQRDPLAVMQRETQSLRTLAGQPGDNDLETLLMAAAAAWPTDRPPVDNLRFEPGKLTLGSAGWSEPQIDQFRNALRPLGWQVEFAEGRLNLSRAPNRVAS